MKILIVHNDYGKPSGEEAVVGKMADIFAGLGHHVARLTMSSAGLRDSLGGKIRAAISGIYSPAGVRALRDAIRREHPDIINVHNVFPLISPAALFEARRAGIPVVMTIHNFRLICPTGLFMRDGRPCELCLERGNEWACLRHNCENAHFKSLAYTLRSVAARRSGAFRKCVTRFACITDFQRRKLIAAGFPADRISVIPNPMDVPANRAAARTAPGDYVAFCGRLSAEKGVDMIIDAARRHPEIPFRLAGEVRDPELVADLPANVTLAGFLRGKDLEYFYRNARFVVMASRCYEGFPMAILEAARYGLPTVGPDHGGFSEIIGGGDGSPIGVLCSPNDSDALEQAIADLWRNPERCAALGASAKEALRKHYSTDVVAGRWQQLIDDVLSTSLVTR